MLCCAKSIAQARLSADKAAVDITVAGKHYLFNPSFLILYNEQDPGMALKPGNIKKVSYNVLTWKTTDTAKSDYQQKKVSAAVAGDGFDDNILRSKAELRAVSVYNAGVQFTANPTSTTQKGDTVFFQFPANDQFVLKAYALLNTQPYASLFYSFKPLRAGYYSIGYTGAPAIDKDKAEEIWQPMIWQEKRFPEKPFLTPSYMSMLPTTMVNDGSNTIGVLASPKYLPFQPLPVLENSQFGITLLNSKGQLQPQVFAPIPGGYLSQMKAGDQFDFSMQFVVEPATVNKTYEIIAKNIFGFKDYRHNDIASLNMALDNIIDYSLSHFAWFIDSLKGCAYSTDVPGAVKNVSGLNPLELALVMNDSVMFEKRAYPLIEFLLSREKFLFSLDSTQKIQSPSRKLKGPIAPLSELAALYNVFNKQNGFYLPMIEKEFKSSRVRNLDGKEKGDNWINAMFLYKSTGKQEYLQSAVKMAKKYLQQRIEKTQTAFNDPMQGSYFFWPTYTGHWIEFSELYELTHDTAFLQAAHEGARYYTMFTWMSPAIPDSNITVNKGGKAPMYWYLKSKGHKQMYYPEEQAPAWRLSEMGLTPESSGTATGHRAIFMANYAPWMLRVGYYTKDTFLMNVAKAAIIGRYRNFPGYHINTERTTAYEKADFPLHEHKDQSVNSFHYNHILPLASMLLDYLITDAFVRSEAQVFFPDEYIEGYAYLQNKLYGAAKGNFYEEKNVQLWMPARLLKSSNVELNYIAARKDNKLFIAFTNQSDKPVTSTIVLNPSLVKVSAKSTIASFTAKSTPNVKDSTFNIIVPAKGIASVVINNVTTNASFQQRLLADRIDNTKDYATIPEGNAHAFLFKMGAYARRLYVYLEDDDNKWSAVKLIYTDVNGKKQAAVKSEYPYEFTIPVDLKKSVSFSLELTGTDGSTVTSSTIELGK